MLQYLPAAGEALKGVGQIASALGIGGGGGLDRKEYRDQLKIQQKVFRESLPLNIEAFKSAGIHPLVGMGAMPPTNQAQVTSGSPDFGERLSAMGQGVGRAASAFMDKSERAAQETANNLALENMALQNDLLRSQITSINRPSNPALPSPFTEPSQAIGGQADSSFIRGDVRDILSGRDAAGFSGLTSDVRLSRSPDGSLAVVPGDVKQDIEDMIIPEIQWWLRRMTDTPDNLRYNPFTGKVYPVEDTTGYKVGRKLRGLYDRFTR